MDTSNSTRKYDVEKSNGTKLIKTKAYLMKLKEHNLPHQLISTFYSLIFNNGIFIINLVTSPSRIQYIIKASIKYQQRVTWSQNQVICSC